ncbi:MAG: hypothetical protein N2169_02350, partial [bacterium]|nr:hypothetical protein [bacterium]
VYLYKLIPIGNPKEILKFFYKTIIKNIFILILILFLLFILIEGSTIITLLKSFYYNSSNILYSLIFILLYFLSFYLIRYNRKYLILLLLIIVIDNQLFFNMYDKFINHINNKIINLDVMERDFKYVEKISKIKENNTLIFNRMINSQQKYSKPPLTCTNYISKIFKIKTVNIYDPFIDLEYFYIFNMDNLGFF